jgi:hypothetical protein
MARAPHTDPGPPDNLLTFALSKERDQLFVRMDAAGIDLLMHRLSRLKAHLEKGHSEHEHLFTCDWLPDGDLSSTAVELDEHLIHGVTLYGYTDEHVQEYHLRDAQRDGTNKA